MQQEAVFAVFVGIALKLLLIPAYKSTDYEVHRNWLAITYSRPLSEWYYETTSQWTLDYPPMFAYFEWFLSQFAAYFDKNMLRVDALEYVSDASVIFQRLTVIASEAVLVYASIRWSRLLSSAASCQPERPTNGRMLPAFIYASLLVNVGLILVDNIHFQYNGFLFGVLLLSLAAAFERAYLRCAFWFSVLVTLKHIYVYVAPAYVVFLLRVYCLRVWTGSVKHARPFRTAKRIAVHPLARGRQRAKASEVQVQNSVAGRSIESELESELENALQSTSGLNVVHCVKLGAVLATVATVALGPFVWAGGMEQINQILARLFPFRRGLSHAYWAPNCWALYNTIEKFIKLGSARLSGAAHTEASRVASLTGGLVGESDFEFLPNVLPVHTFAFTAVSMLPALWTCWVELGRALEVGKVAQHSEERLVQLTERLDKQSTRLGNALLKCVVQCAFSSFLFGWHVHEKAILLCTVPLTLLAAQSAQYAGLYFYLTVLGYYSLFPLLFTPLEAAIKVLLLTCHTLICHRLLRTLFSAHVGDDDSGKSSGENGKTHNQTSPRIECYFRLPRIANAHLALIPFHYVALFVLYDQSRFGTSLPFVPLMFTSVFCAVGVLASWLWLHTLDAEHPGNSKAHSD